MPVALGAVLQGIGFAAASQAAGIWQFALAHGLLIGVGGSASFGPVIADISLWFLRRRGIAVAICSSGSYLAGAIWPLMIQPLAQSAGWRPTYLGIGLFCIVAMLPLAVALRRRNRGGVGRSLSAGSGPVLPAGLTPNRLQVLLMLAGIFCCAAMAMPQVHIVAYCADLGFGGSKGARMLSLMLGAGIISRLSFGLIADRIGSLAALLLSSSLQAAALLLYFWSNGLTSLYVVTALFGLVQGGIVLTYTLIVREYYPPSEAGTRVGLVLLLDTGGNGDWRLDVGRDLRRDALLPRGISQWLRVELMNIAIAVAILAPAPAPASGVCIRLSRPECICGRPCRLI